MDPEAIKRIDAFLRSHGSSWELQPKARQTQFEKVDAAIQAMTASMGIARHMAEASRINISSVSTSSGVSRKTFYNNDLLKAYVEHFAGEGTVPGLDPEEVKRLKEQNSVLASQIQAFLVRDIETENLRHENMKLCAEIKNLQLRIQNLESQYAGALKKIQELQKIPIGTKRIMPFTSGE